MKTDYIHIQLGGKKEYILDKERKFEILCKSKTFNNNLINDIL